MNNNLILGSMLVIHTQSLMRCKHESHLESLRNLFRYACRFGMNDRKSIVRKKNRPIPNATMNAIGGRKSDNNEPFKIRRMNNGIDSIHNINNNKLTLLSS